MKPFYDQTEITSFETALKNELFNKEGGGATPESISKHFSFIFTTIGLRRFAAT